MAAWRSRLPKLDIPLGAVVERYLRRAGLTTSGGAAIALALVGWAAARVIGAKAMYLMVYAGLLVLVMAWLVARRRLALEVDRSSVPSRVRVGQTVGINLVVRARRRASTIVVEEQLHERLGQPVSVPVDLLRSGESLEHSYSFTPSLRGVYQVGPVRATWSDPFGLTSHEQELAPAVELIVHPLTEPARDRVLTRMWEDPPVRPPVSKPWPVGFEFYGMREYVPGDDLRMVVWPAYAKTGTLMVRESEQGITDRIVVVVDTDADWHSPGEISESFESAVRAAASAGVQHIHDGFSVTLMANEGIVAEGLRGTRAHLELLDALARIGTSATPLQGIGFRLLEEAKHRPHVLVVTPHLSDAAAQQLKLIVDRGLSVVVAQILWDESDAMTGSRAASIGAGVVQIPLGASLSAAFSSMVGARR